MIEEEIYDGCCPYCGEDILIEVDQTILDYGTVGRVMHCTNCLTDFTIKRKRVTVVEVEL